MGNQNSQSLACILEHCYSFPWAFLLLCFSKTRVKKKKKDKTKKSAYFVGKLHLQHQSVGIQRSLALVQCKGQLKFQRESTGSRLLQLFFSFFFLFFIFSIVDPLIKLLLVFLWKIGKGKSNLRPSSRVTR